MGEGVPVPPWETSCEIVTAGSGASGGDSDDDAGCLLRLRSGFDSGGQLPEEAVSGSVDGWVHALTVLAHRLTHRPADGVVTVDAATDPVSMTVPELWARVSAQLVAPAAAVGAGVPGGGVDRSGAVARSGEVGGIVAAESTASLTLILSGPVDGMLELFAFPAGETHEDAAGAGRAGGAGVRVCRRARQRRSPLSAAAVDVEPTWTRRAGGGWTDSRETRSGPERSLPRAAVVAGSTSRISNTGRIRMRSETEWRIPTRP